MPALPFKLNQDRRPRIPKQRRRIANPAAHDAALRQRGSLTIWFTIRARAEITINRLKPVIGDGLRSRTERRRATEVDVAVHALNRMLELGRPISVRIA